MIGTLYYKMYCIETYAILREIHMNYLQNKKATLRYIVLETFQAGLEQGSSEPANTALSKAIQAELTKIKSTLTPDDILNRATTQSCAGCHEVSTFGLPNALGGGLTWPASNGFTQIDENGNESSALTTVFLPFRIS